MAQSEVAYSVNDAEVDRFGFAPHDVRHFALRHVKDLRRRRYVYVHAVLERVGHFRVARKMRDQL